MRQASNSPGASGQEASESVAAGEGSVARSAARLVGLFETLAKSEEGVSLAELSATVGAPIGDGTGAATIVNDDFPTLSVGDVTLPEGEGGTIVAVPIARLALPCLPRA